MSRTDDCRARAEAAEAKARTADDDPVIRHSYLEMARQWRGMADTYERIDQRRDAHKRGLRDVRP